jgi:large subunit ribosomal protein L4
MKAKVYRQDGSAQKNRISLDEAVFGVEPNDHAIWLDVRRIQANARQGTHKTKEKSEVRGSTRKLYRQKGTGYARAGSAKSPIRKSGGRMFGPRPHLYSVDVNRKTQRLARRSALSYKAGAESVIVVENFDYDEPSTSAFRALLSAMEIADGAKVLFLTSEYAPSVYRSARNLPGVTVRQASDVSTLDVMKADVVVAQKGALDVLSGILGPAVEAE